MIKYQALTFHLPNYLIRFFINLIIYHRNFFKCKNLLSSTPAYKHWKQSASPKMSKTSSLLEHNLPYAKHVKLLKLQYLIRLWWHFILHNQDMNNMACPTNENFFITLTVSLHFCFGKSYISAWDLHPWL